MRIDKIILGERDRDDLGDVEALAKSISEVGLLHPIVVTADMDLVAGGRRIAAVKSLGWESVAVTVADLSTVAEVLQAEADENTCRKPLTPYEASNARRRRAAILTPKAKASQGSRSDLQPSPNLGEGSKSREVNKAAALHTGYSGSTLDKVDRIRDAAERGVVRQGRQETPAPAPVIDIAKKSLEGVKKTGAAVDRGSREFEASVEAFVDTDPSVQRARLMKKFTEAQAQMSAVTSYEVAAVANAMSQDDFEVFQTLKSGVDHWADRLDKEFNRPLHAINGGK